MEDIVKAVSKPEQGQDLRISNLCDFTSHFSAFTHPAAHPASGELHTQTALAALEIRSK